MKIHIAAAAFALLISTSVKADNLFYGAFEAGGSFPTGKAVMDGAGNSYAVALGVQPNKFLGFEVGVGYSDWKIYSDAKYTKVISNSSLTRLTATAFGYLPINDSVSIFGSVGNANDFYRLFNCKSCASDQVNTSSKSVTRGVGVAWGTKDTNFPLVRLGFERYAVNTPLIEDLSVDHLYLQVMMEIN